MVYYGYFDPKSGDCFDGFLGFFLSLSGDDGVVGVVAPYDVVLALLSVLDALIWLESSESLTVVLASSVQHAQQDFLHVLKHL